MKSLHRLVDLFLAYEQVQEEYLNVMDTARTRKYDDAKIYRVRGALLKLREELVSKLTEEN